jgi:hypothetical protein
MIFLKLKFQFKTLQNNSISEDHSLINQKLKIISHYIEYANAFNLKIIISQMKPKTLYHDINPGPLAASPE